MILPLGATREIVWSSGPVKESCMSIASRWVAA